MHPFAHIVWASLWSGIASSAVDHARTFVRATARKNPSAPPMSALRLAEADNVLQTMRSGIEAVALEYRRMLEVQDREAFRSYGFAIRINNLKLAASRLVADIVTDALAICGVEAYRNDSPFSLGRQLRDAHSAALMIHNDRIVQSNEALLLVHKGT